MTDTSHGFYIRWLLISLWAQKQGLYETSEEKIGNLKEGDLSIGVSNHSQCCRRATLHDQPSNLKTIEIP